MAKYKAIKRGYDGTRVQDEGSTFEFEGVPGTWMEPMDAKAEAAMSAMYKAEGIVPPKSDPVEEADEAKVEPKAKSHHSKSEK